MVKAFGAQLNTFNQFFDSEKSSGILLIVCTVLSIAITNSPIGAEYRGFWHRNVGGLNLGQWINDALMAIFFLLIGLELERELYIRELSNIRNALLPIAAAIGPELPVAGWVQFSAKRSVERRLF